MLLWIILLFSNKLIIWKEKGGALGNCFCIEQNFFHIDALNCHHISSVVMRFFVGLGFQTLFIYLSIIWFALCLITLTEVFNFYQIPKQTSW